MRLLAPAKINWTLEVLGRREDGYHEVRTLMQAVSLCDELEIEPADGLTLETDGSHAAEEDDLVLRAARSLQHDSQGARIRLHKRIPAAAGLGGGSSDAAVTLRGLNQFWQLGMDADALSAMTASLGSDVPFFLHGGTALATGRGEQVKPLPDLPSRWLVLLSPPLSLGQKTATMYAALQPSDFSDGALSGPALKQLQKVGDIEDGLLGNVFQRAAFELWPPLAGYAACLRDATGSPPHLAGSGPALFALVADEAAARAACERLTESDAACFALRTLSRAESLTVSE